MSRIPKKKNHVWLRRFTKLVFALFCALMACALVLFFIPFYSPVLDRQIQNAWNQITNLRLSYQKATFHLAAGKIDLSGIQIVDPSDNKRLMKVETMALRWDWDVLHPRRLMDLKAIEIAAPSPLKLYLSPDNRIVLDESVERFLDLVSRLSSRSGATGSSSSLAQITVKDFPAYLYRQTAGGVVLLASIVPLDWEFRSGEGGTWTLALDGALKGKDRASKLAMQVQKRKNDPALHFNLSVNQFDSSQQIGMELPVLFSAKMLSLKGSYSPSSRDFTVLLTSPSAGLSFPSKNIALPDGPIEIDMDGGAPSTSTLQVRDFSARAINSFIQAHGLFDLGTTHSFECRVETARFSSQCIGLLQRHLPENWGKFDISQGVMSCDARFSGNMQGIHWDTATGAIEATDMMLKWDRLPKPIGPVAISASLNPQSLNVSRFEISPPSNHFLASGDIERNPNPENGQRKVMASWNTELLSEDALTYLPLSTQESLKKWKLQGKVQGGGLIRGSWSDSTATLASGSRLQDVVRKIFAELKISGALQLQGANLDHPALPSPLKNLSGGIVLTNDSLEFTSLSGEFLNSRVAITGTSKGSPFFWQKPSANLRITGDLDLTKAANLMPSERRAIFQKLRPEGRLQVDLTCADNMADWEQASVTGGIKAEAVGVNLESAIASADMRRSECRYPDSAG